MTSGDSLPPEASEPEGEQPSKPVGLAGLNLPKADSPLAGLSPAARQDVLEAVRKGMRVRDAGNADAAVKLAARQREVFPKILAVSAAVLPVALGIIALVISASSKRFDPVGYGVACGVGVATWIGVMLMLRRRGERTIRLNTALLVNPETVAPAATPQPPSEATRPLGSAAKPGARMVQAAVVISALSGLLQLTTSRDVLTALPGALVALGFAATLARLSQDHPRGVAWFLLVEAFTIPVLVDASSTAVVAAGAVRSVAVALAACALVVTHRWSREVARQEGERRGRSGPWWKPSRVYLAAIWRVALPVTWIGGITSLNVVAPNSGDAHYSALVSAAQGLPIIAFFVVPVLAALGWRSARLASVVGAGGALVLSIVDLNKPRQAGGAEIAVSSVMMTISVLAILTGRLGNGRLRDRERPVLRQR